MSSTADRSLTHRSRSSSPTYQAVRSTNHTAAAHQRNNTYARGAAGYYGLGSWLDSINVFQRAFSSDPSRQAGSTNRGGRRTGRPQQAQYLRTHNEADEEEQDDNDNPNNNNILDDDDDDHSTLSNEDFDDDFDYGYYDRGLPPPPGSHWRLAGGLVLLVFLGASIWTSSSQKKRIQHAPMDAQLQYCQDPIMSLVDQSLLEGLSQAAVAADHPHCSRMGMAILQEQGGNAVDAAVTVALCLGVANPGSSGMGGGAFMLIHADAPKEDHGTDHNNNDNLPPFVDARTGPSPKSASGKTTEVIDCREIAPAKATTDMYKNQPEYATVLGGLAVGVPGELRGLELAHARHGRLPWAQVVDPVMRLAMRGIEVNPNLAHEIRIMANKFNDSSLDFGLRDLLTRTDSWTRPLREGELLQNQRLGELLQDIMNGGSKALYTDRAEALAQDIQDAGGIVTAEDIRNYKATIRSPLVAHDINGFSIVGVPPPSSGGAAIIGAARFLSGYQSPLVSYSDTLSRHRLVEACRHVFAIRMSLSDPAFNNETVQRAVNDLISGDYIESLRRITKDDSVLPASQYGGATWAQLKDSDANHNVSDAQEGDRRRRERRLRHHFGYLNDGGTSHFSIVDNDGNSVVMTTSVNTYFGSNVVSKSTGIVLSNTMDDFSIPGSPNYFGLRPSVSNYIKPGKKPLSSMSPTLVFRKLSEEEHDTLGTLVLAIGASGGPKIITAVLQVLLSVVIEGMSLYTSLVRPRLHDQLLYHGGTVTTTERATLESGPVIQVSERTKDALTARDHVLIDIDYTGTVQAVSYDPESKLISAVCDVRKGGSPAGY